MDGIYRIPLTTVEPPRDRGIVGEVIGQFADPFAFYRELVQNAIDAGTAAVEVHIDHDAGAREVRVGVRDTGEGMTREIVEDQLLVLFRSTKENDDSKIGKFGIGFASVLAPAPELVVVNTSRDGRRLTLHLHRDLSYELFDAGPATRTGTTVELEIPLTTSLEAFVTASTQALVQWCRHAQVPIHLIARDAGATVAETRIDRPLALDEALVQVQVTSADGHTTAVVGLTIDATAYAGFFDHGLTLFEDIDPDFGRFAFKVQDARLAHTLSRDNVRRDEAYDRAVAFARHVAARELPLRVAGELAAAAARDRERYTALCWAIRRSALVIPNAAWRFPLIEPIGNARIVDIQSAGYPPRCARHTSAITAMLAQAGVPVIDVGPTGELAGMTQDRIGVTPIDVHHELTRVAPIAASDTDVALLVLVAELIEHAHRKPAGLSLAELDGAFGSCLAITGERADAALAVDGDDDPEAPYLIDRRHGGRKPFGRLVRAPVVISASHLHVVAARRLAHTDPITAASILARVLLLAAGVLDVDRSTRLLEATLAAHGVGGGW